MGERQAGGLQVAGLEVAGLAVTLGGRRVLRDISFEAPAGRTTAVLGPSGCGKTTLLRAVCGLQQPDEGQVLVGGRDVSGVPAHERGMGLAFQDRALFPHLDVAGNVAFGLRMAGVSEPATVRRVREVLALVGLEGFEGRRVGSLSGGEAQRVALARSLAPDPAVLCLDEPLGSLDRVLHDRLVEDLRALFDALATTVLLVTHDHAEALALADHLVVVGSAEGPAEGPAAATVLAAGSPREIWLRPPTVAVARFLGHQVLDALSAAALGMDTGGTPWVVVHASAVQLVPGGGAVVRDSLFVGGRTVVRVEVPGVGLVQADTGAWAGPSAGDRVDVRVDPAGVWPVGS